MSARRRLEDLSTTEAATWCWGVGADDERLDRDARHCVEMYLDDLDPAEWPDELTVTAYERRILKAYDVDHQSFLEDILERLDEDHVGDDCDKTEPTPAMTAAARKLSEAIAADYEVHWCDKVEDFTVDVKRWVEATSSTSRTAQSSTLTTQSATPWRIRGGQEVGRTCGSG